jgi:hypothetical protein
MHAVSRAASEDTYARRTVSLAALRCFPGLGRTAAQLLTALR